LLHKHLAEVSDVGGDVVAESKGFIEKSEKTERQERRYHFCPKGFCPKKALRCLDFCPKGFCPVFSTKGKDGDMKKLLAENFFKILERFARAVAASADTKVRLHVRFCTAFSLSISPSLSLKMRHICSALVYIISQPDEVSGNRESSEKAKTHCTI
jgi:hypothetical protein